MLTELVVCSLESWDDVWRRNQFFVRELLRTRPELRILFVEPASDVLHAVMRRARPQLPRLRHVESRLVALRPLKVLPRRLGPLADELLQRQVQFAARRLGFSRPVLWLNDVAYAPLIERTGWPTVYDVTDDWLAVPDSQRRLDRLAALEAAVLDRAHAVVVCSPGLLASRGRNREVTLIPNGVDVEHFRAPRRRPHDLPPSPVAVYVGTLHSSRLDVELVVETARALPDVAFAFVGPDSLTAGERRRLLSEPNVSLLGARRYDDVPAYLQHADVVVVPHVVTSFTESLDPIKAYECAAVETPTVATPVAGFRELAPRIAVGARAEFPALVREAIGRTSPPVDVPTWAERAAAYAGVLEDASGRVP